MKISNYSNSQVLYRRTPAQEAIDHANHMEIKALQSPIVYGSPKQIAWAKSIFENERYYWYAFEYAITDLQLFLASEEARSATWWIENRPECNGSGRCRIAMDKVISDLKANQASPEEKLQNLRRLIQRF